MNKKEIINYQDKGFFLDFLSKDHTGEVLRLFDDEGIAILEKSDFRQQTIAYILNWSSYASDLLQNEKFVKLLLSDDISYYYASLTNFDSRVYDFILQTALSVDLDNSKLAELFSYFKTDYQINFVKNKKIQSEELLYRIFKKGNPAVMQTIIENYDINLLSHNINLDWFFRVAKDSVLSSQASKYASGEDKKHISISSSMLDERVADKLWQEYNIFQLREILDNAQYCTDASYLNQMIKNKEDNFINNEIDDLLSKVDVLCEKFENMKRAMENGDYDDNYYDNRNEYRDLINNVFSQELHSKMNRIYAQEGIDAVKKCVDTYINNTVSNYIIDHCFDVNYYNVMIDVRELLSYSFDGNISLDEDRLYLYDKISNIDYLPLDEKIEFYNQLKQYNVKEMFYDDMSFARKIVGEMIKDYSLSSESLQEYKDEELSKKYGVPVYKMDGKPFFGIVKTGYGPETGRDQLPAGHSYSLIGDKGLAVFGNLSNSSTFMYDSSDLNPRQLVHVFPYDSFTYYQPFQYSTDASHRVNMLLTPSQLVETSKSYNELLILEKGREKFEFDDSIPQLKRMALYCLDEISKQDVEAASRAGVGIFLVDSSKYSLKETSKYDLYDHERFASNYQYYEGFTEDMFDKHR